MKTFKKVSLLTALTVLVSTFAFALAPRKDILASGAEHLGTYTGYTEASDVNYVKTNNYVHNWGARGEECVFTTSYANNFYTGSYTFDQLSTKAGSSTISSVPQSALYDALQDLMSSKQSYQTSYNATRDLYRYTDCVNGNSSYISSFYSGERLNGAWDGGSTWNREHTWPNSKGDLSGNGENDIMMLRPASVSENSSRGNKAYGQSSGYYDPNGEGQKLRGDCARIILYVYVRWGCINTGSYNSRDIFGTGGVIESVDVLLRWMQEDPVDTWEMGRNDAVQSITGTRNVFVDYPEYAWMLFGRSIPSNMGTPSGIASNGTYVPPTPPASSESSDSSSAPEDDEMTATEILNALYGLSDGESLSGNYTLTGVITSLDSYKNPTIVVDGMTSKPVYCYRLVDDRFVVGATITVSSTTLKNYQGTYEMMNCTLDSITLPGTTPPADSSSSSTDSSSSSSSIPEDSSNTNIPNATGSIVVTGSAFGVNSEDYAREERSATVSGTTFGFVQVGNYSDGLLRMRTKDGVHGAIWNKTALPGQITKLVLKYNPAKSPYAGNGYVIKLGNTSACNEKTLTLSTTTDTTWTIEIPGNYTYFKIEHNNTYTQYWDSLEIFYAADEDVPPQDSSSSSYVPEDSSSSSYVPEDSSSSSYVPEDSSSSSYVPEDSSSKQPDSSVSSNSSSSSSSSVLEDSSSDIPEDSSSEAEDSSNATSSVEPDNSSSELPATSSKEEADCTNGHDFSDWVVIRPATETEDGKRMRTCNVCGGAEMETLPKLGGDSSVIDSSVTDSSSENSQDSEQPSSGCASTVGTSFVGAVLAAGAILAIRKKKED